jgi:hypothetical protein
MLILLFDLCNLLPFGFPNYKIAELISTEAAAGIPRNRAAQSTTKVGVRRLPIEMGSMSVRFAWAMQRHVRYILSK